MKVFDKLAQKLALRWLKGKADKARREESGFMKALDGWKSFIVVLGFIGASVAALVTGQDVGGLLTPIFQAVGWSQAEELAKAKTFATVVAPLLLAVWAAASRLWKAVKQYRSGARAGELLSTEGYVKQARAEGLIR